MLVGIGGTGGEVRRVLLDGPSVDVTLDEPVRIVRPNAGAAGFFRVRYSPDLLAALAATAQDDLDAVERYTLVDDTWASVLAGTTDAADLLELTAGLQRGAERLGVEANRRLAHDADARRSMANRSSACNARVRALATPAVERVGR